MDILNCTMDDLNDEVVRTFSVLEKSNEAWVETEEGWDEVISLASEAMENWESNNKTKENAIIAHQILEEQKPKKDKVLRKVTYKNGKRVKTVIN